MKHNLSNDGTGSDRPDSIRPFLIIWAGQAFSLMGSELVQFALIWWMTRESKSAVVLTTATIVSLLPRMLLMPFAGALVDRWRRRKILILADTFIALATLVLAALFAAGIAEIWHIYVLLVVRSLGSVFHRPAMMASTTLMVPKKHLSRVAGMNETLSGALSIVSPPLGALLMDLLPLQSILMIDVITALAAIIPLFFIDVPQPSGWDQATGKLKTKFFDDFKAGLHYALSWKGLMFLVVVYALVHLLFTPAMSLMPILVTNHYQGGAQELAWLESAVGIGLISGGLLLSIWNLQKKRIYVSMLAMTLVGLMVLLMGFAPPGYVWLGVIGTAGMGLTVSLVTGLRRAILQSVVPPEMQGRVFSLILAATIAMDPLGLMIAGPLTDATRVEIWYLITGVGVILMGISTFFIPAIMQVEEVTPAVAGLAGTD